MVRELKALCRNSGVRITITGRKAIQTSGRLGGNVYEEFDEETLTIRDAKGHTIFKYQKK